MQEPTLPRGYLVHPIWVRDGKTNSPASSSELVKPELSTPLMRLFILFTVSNALFCLSLSVQDYEIEYMEKIGSSSPVSS